MTSNETIEHRREPRYRHLVPVRIGGLELATANVSLHGIQVVCPVMPFRRIKPDVDRGQLAAQIVLPRGATLEATLSVRYCSPYRDEMLIGARLDLADPGAQAQWAAYIDEVSKGIRLTSKG